MAKGRLMISIPKASVDGVFHGRFPNGDAPHAALAGAAATLTSASASLTTASGGGGMPSAVQNVTAFAAPGAAYVLFSPPASSAAHRRLPATQLRPALGRAARCLPS